MDTKKSEQKYVNASGSGQALIKLNVYEDDTATVVNETYQQRLYPRQGGYAQYEDAKAFYDSCKAVARTGA